MKILRSKTHSRLKRTLFNWTKHANFQGSPCSNYVQQKYRKTINSHSLCQLDAGRLAERQVYAVRKQVSYLLRIDTTMFIMSMIPPLINLELDRKLSSRCIFQFHLSDAAVTLKFDWAHYNYHEKFSRSIWWLSPYYLWKISLYWENKTTYNFSYLPCVLPSLHRLTRFFMAVRS